MSDFVPGLVLGAVLGLAVGALAVVGLARSVMRLTGTRTAWTVLRFLGAGLLPGRPRDGAAVERTTSRVLKEQYSQLASGARVAATSLTLRIAPEDHAVLIAGPGLELAADDLRAFYVSHAGASGWRVLADPELTIERDISLRPRQVRVRSGLRAPAAGVPMGTPVTSEPPRSGPSPVLPLATSTPEARTGASAARRPAPAPVSAPVPASASDPEPAPLHGAHPARPAAVPDGVDPTAHSGPATAPTLVLDDLRPAGAAVTEVLDLGDLVVRAGSAVHVVPRGSAAVLGRGPRADIRVDGPGVAEEHVRLESREDGWWVVPLVPTARTTIGGDRMQEPGRVGAIAFLGLGHLTRLELGVQPLAA